MIAPEVIEQVRDAADLVTLIGEHVELKRTGSDWRGPCPFHGGTHRNFSVVPRKQMYHCFVCHESGDVFTFWMKKFGLDYPTAVREIAGRVGIVIPETRSLGPDPNEPFYSALGVAAEWFQRRLRESDDAALARTYLGTRDLDEEARDEFGLGFSHEFRRRGLPPRPDNLQQLSLAFSHRASFRFNVLTFPSNESEAAEGLITGIRPTAYWMSDGPCSSVSVRFARYSASKSMCA